MASPADSSSRAILPNLQPLGELRRYRDEPGVARAPRMAIHSSREMTPSLLRSTWSNIPSIDRPVLPIMCPPRAPIRLRLPPAPRPRYSRSRSGMPVLRVGHHGDECRGEGLSEMMPVFISGTPLVGKPQPCKLHSETAPPSASRDLPCACCRAASPAAGAACSETFPMCAGAVRTRTIMRIIIAAMLPSQIRPCRAG